MKETSIGRATLGALFFASGALGLVYEVVWHRQFSVLFGSAAPAAAAVLAAFFLGLGLGNYLCGRWSARLRSPLLAYGWLEIAIGLGALVAQPMAAGLSCTLMGVRESAGPGVLVMKGLFAFIAIAIPTVAMGGTLPILAELVDAGKEKPGERVGWLYVVNTTGAALGALAFPYVLLPAIGVGRTVLLCAGANILIGVLAIGLARKAGGRPPRGEEAKAKARAAELPRPLALAFVSGAGTFALQVLWNRAFAQIHENSIFSFALIVAVFIAAIAAGGQLARVLLRRGGGVRKAFSGVWLAGAVAVAISPFLFVKLSGGLEFLPGNEAGMGGRLALLLGFSVFVPIALLAAGMPLLFEDAVRGTDRSTGDRTGSLLAANIAGAVTGAVLAGFALPPLLGLWRAVIGMGLIFLLTAWLARCVSTSGRWAAAGTVGVLFVLALQIELPRVWIDTRGGERLLGLAEGAHGIVAVSERGPSRRLKLNNHYVLGGTAALGDERMQAHLPLLLHPNPTNIVFLGYGTGITAGGATFHSGVVATGVELVPEVAAFASRFFGGANGNFGTTHGTRVVVNDARDFLRGRHGQFDVIIGDLVVPWRPGESSLYTREHFANVRLALAPGGLACVWLPMFQLSEAQFRIVLNTFLAEFPNAAVWRGDFSPNEPALALVAFRDGEELLQPEAVARRIGKMGEDPSNPQLKYAAAFWMHFVGFVTAESAGSAERRLNSEDWPWLELQHRAGGSKEKNDYFVGRRFQQWEEQVRAGSRGLVEARLRDDALAGWRAGSVMLEYTFLLSEGRERETAGIRARAHELLGENAARAVFGPGP